MGENFKIPTGYKHTHTHRTTVILNAKSMKQFLVNSSRVDTVVLLLCQVHLLPWDLQISTFLTSGVSVLIFHTLTLTLECCLQG